MMAQTIVDWQDPRLEPYRNLRDAALREQQGRFVAEGTETIRMLLRSSLRVESVILKPSLLDDLAAEIADRREVPVYHADPDLLAQVVGYRLHRGALACGLRPMDRGEEILDALLSDGCPCRLLVLDAVHDVGNVGGIIRSARGLGIDAVILGPGCADCWYRRSIRVSMGHVFHQRLIHSPDLPALLERLTAAGIACYAGQLGAESTPVGDLAPGSRWAVVVGNEDRAVRPTVAARCRPVHIPMAPGVDSLNAGVSAALLAHALLLLEDRS